MNEVGAYEASKMPGGLDLELQRLRDQALLAWEKEARNLEWFGMRDGMRVLELGGGPGFVTGQLLEMLPSGKITVVERDPVLIERARGYLAGRGEGRLQIIEGNVMDMELPDNSFDFAYGRLIFQHLPDPVGAAREVLRVLKPGGRLVIADIDDALHLFDPAEPEEVKAITARFREEHAAKGGDRYVGRKLVRLLKEAGFERCDIEFVVAHSDVLGVEKVLPRPPANSWQPDVDEGRITPEEKRLLEEADEDFYASDPIAMLAILMAVGHKPARV